MQPCARVQASVHTSVQTLLSCHHLQDMQCLLTPAVSTLQAPSADAGTASPVQALGGTAKVATTKTASHPGDKDAEFVRGRQHEEGSPTPEAGNACSESTV